MFHVPPGRSLGLHSFGCASPGMVAAPAYHASPSEAGYGDGRRKCVSSSQHDMVLASQGRPDRLDERRRGSTASRASHDPRARPAMSVFPRVSHRVDSSASRRANHSPAGGSCIEGCTPGDGIARITLGRVSTAIRSPERGQAEAVWMGHLWLNAPAATMSSARVKARAWRR